MIKRNIQKKFGGKCPYPPVYGTLHRWGGIPIGILEWLYLLRSAKLCAVHDAQSGPLTGAKNLCAVAALPAAQPTYYVSKTPLLAGN